MLLLLCFCCVAHQHYQINQVREKQCILDMQKVQSIVWLKLLTVIYTRNERALYLAAMIATTWRQLVVPSTSWYPDFDVRPRAYHVRVVDILVGLTPAMNLYFYIYSYEPFVLAAFWTALLVLSPASSLIISSRIHPDSGPSTGTAPLSIDTTTTTTCSKICSHHPRCECLASLVVANTLLP